MSKKYVLKMNLEKNICLKKIDTIKEMKKI